MKAIQDALSSRFDLKSGERLRVDCLSHGVFRVRLGQDDVSSESGLNRYGLIEPHAPDLAVEDAAVAQTDHGWTVTTPMATLEIDAQTGDVRLKNANDEELITGRFLGAGKGGRGFKASFSLSDEDKLYGLGHVDCNLGHVDENIEEIHFMQRRGRKYNMIMTNQASYAPVPYMMSPRGWALFMNTTWYHTLDAGASNPEALVFDVEGGSLDYYLMVGDFPKGLLERHTWITGRPSLLPEWGYGFSYQTSNVYDNFVNSAMHMMRTGSEFRKNDIPCDILHVTDWASETMYNYTLDKDFDPDRFAIFRECRASARKTEKGLFGPFKYRFAMNDDHSSSCHCSWIGALGHMGFKVSLWLCCDYDLTDHEERQLASSLAALEEERADEEAKRSAKTTDFDPRLVGPKIMDELTRPGVPWFDHLKKFVDDGVRVFMLDAANIGLPHPDRMWRNGMSDRELHNFHCAIYAKQMYEGFAEHAGKRPMIYITPAAAGTQRFAAMWAGDSGGDSHAMNIILNEGMTGFSNLGADLIAFEPQGIHFGFFQAWVHSTSGYNQPWFHGERIEGIFRFYSKLRHRLLPYIYSMAHVAYRTGYPIMRAMPLEFQDDPQADESLCQYMFGDALLVSAYADEVRLPTGDWFDYWTGDRVEGPVTIPATYPEDRGGPLFAKAGAIIPMGPDVAYWNQKPLDVVSLDVFPGNRSEPFTLYEDDGESDAYQKGRVAETVIDQKLTNDALTVTVSPRRGDYDGMPANRSFQFQIHGDRPKSIQINGKTLPNWTYDQVNRVTHVDAVPQPKQGKLTLKAT